jgi:hypothetical protein
MILGEDASGEEELANRQSLAATFGRHIDRARSCLRFAPVSSPIRCVINPDLDRQGMIDHVGGMIRIVLSRLHGAVGIFGPGQ